ncbi:ABC transporter transmembrane domain-containing protein [Amedibacillus sp. YH-ame6]
MNKEYRYYKNKVKDIKKYKIATIIFSIIYILTSALLVVYLQGIIDKVTSNSVVDIMKTGISYLLVLLFYFLIVLIYQYFFRLLLIKGKYSTQRVIYKEILKNDIGFFNKNQVGKLSSLINNETIQIGNYISSGNVIMFIQSFTLLINIVILIYYHSILTFIIMCIVFMCFISTRIISERIAQYNNEILKQAGENNDYIIQSFEGIKTIKYLSKEGLFIKNFTNLLNIDLFKYERKFNFMNVLYICIYVILNLGLPLTSVLIGVYFVSIDQLSIGSLLAMYTLVSQIQEPIRIIADTTNERKVCGKLSVRLYKEINSNKKDDREVELNNIDCINVELDFVQYGNQKILNNFKLEIKKGEIIYLEGESGCGKSTLLGLVMQSIDNYEGRIMFNGVNSKKVLYKSLYENVLMVDQKNVLFDDTIKNNIFLDETYDENLFNEVIQVCQLQELIKDKGLNYKLYAGSSNISGGQKQRICIARMLIRKPNYLLLDEPTSALDYNTREKFSIDLNEFAKKYDLGLVIISHNSDASVEIGRKVVII